MSNNEKNVKNFQLIILLSVQLYTMASRSVSVPIDGSYSTMYSSPLIMGSNTTNLLKLDFTKPPECITTSGIKDSWILVDLGFIFSGLVQLRLSADNFNQKAHDQLSNVKIEMAQKLPLKTISNFSDHYNSYFEYCGSTGTVSKDTFNVVVDCKTVFTARWVLLRTKKPLNLCHIHIYQNSVQPHCFFPYWLNDLPSSKPKSKFVAFKVIKHVKSLECFEKCKSESTCEGIAFVPISTRTGICQLLKVRNSFSKFICDAKCQIYINRCHLGQKQEVGGTNEDGILELPVMRHNLYALSLEIDGDILCHDTDCGETGIYISDSEEKITSCGLIDPLLYRVLVNNAFLCKNPVKNPQKIIIKTESNSTTYKYRFKSISIRTVEEKSFVLDILKNIRKTSTTFMTSKSTSMSFVSISKKTSKSHTPSKSTKNIASDVRTIKHSTRNPSLPKVNISSFKQSTWLLSSSKISSMKSSPTSIYILTSRTSAPSGKTKLYPFPTKENIVSTILRSGTKSVKMINLARNPISGVKDMMINSTPSVSTNSNIYSTNEKFNSQTNSQMTVILHHTVLTLLKNNDNSKELLTGSMSTNQSTAPYVWIILGIFIIILITVTFIVILITVLESRRKRKEWDIPPNGLFPLRNQGSEPITMQSSLQESLFRKI